LSLPDFTADASLYTTSRIYRASAAHCECLDSGEGIIPAYRPSPGTQATCAGDLADCTEAYASCSAAVAVAVIAGCAPVLTCPAALAAGLEAEAACTYTFLACNALNVLPGPQSGCCPKVCGIPNPLDPGSGCCDHGEQCVDESDPNSRDGCCANSVCGGNCCLPGESCCGDACCPAGHACQQGVCCPPNTAAVCNGVCCDGFCDQNGNCCDPPSGRCPGSNVCCPPFNKCCGATCCGFDEICHNGSCCSQDRICGGGCCPPGQQCDPGTQTCSATGGCLAGQHRCVGQGGLPNCCPEGTDCCPGGLCCPTGNDCCVQGGVCRDIAFCLK
jgi:hypothetical protein